jgi:hypothetical protein
MLEEKDEELEKARMIRARTNEQTEGIPSGKDAMRESDPSRTLTESDRVATSAAVADASDAYSAAGPSIDAKETAAEVTVATPSLSAETAESSRLDYLRNVIAKFLVTDDWETQDRLVPVIGAVLGFSETELAAVKTKRDALTPLDIRAARLIG